MRGERDEEVDVLVLLLSRQRAAAAVGALEDLVRESEGVVPQAAIQAMLECIAKHAHPQL